jgi:hypothetical protein
MKKKKVYCPNKAAWRAMHWRCKNNMYYEGLSVCERWGKYENFIADMGFRPNDNLSLDRINNAMGYSPENCRWASKAVQAHNTRARNKYKGVSRRYRKFKATIKCSSGKNWNLGTFTTDIEAAIAYNNAAKLAYGDFASVNKIL